MKSGKTAAVLDKQIGGQQRQLNGVHDPCTAGQVCLCAKESKTSSVGTHRATEKNPEYFNCMAFRLDGRFVEPHRTCPNRDSINDMHPRQRNERTRAVAVN